LLRHRARHDVVAATRRERHDEPDRPLGIVLRKDRQREERARNQDDQPAKHVRSMIQLAYPREREKGSTMPNASRIVLGILYPIAALLLAAQTAGAQNARVYVTNSAGDNIHVIDPATNKVVQVIDGIEAAHGIDFSPDGTRVYVSNESDSTLDVFDAKTGRLASKVKL